MEAVIFVFLLFLLTLYLESVRDQEYCHAKLHWHLSMTLQLGTDDMFYVSVIKKKTRLIWFINKFGKPTNIKILPQNIHFLQKNQSHCSIYSCEFCQISFNDSCEDNSKTVLYTICLFKHTVQYLSVHEMQHLNCTHFQWETRIEGLHHWQSVGKS